MKSTDQGNQTAVEDKFVHIPMKNIDAYTDFLP